MSNRLRNWLRLGLALALLAGGIALLHVASPHAPGAVGRTYASNVTLKIDPRAYFYTELGEVSEFLDARQGRYGQLGEGNTLRLDDTERKPPHKP